ncbi:hypothetical protein, partial [Microcoleus sp. PH2017_12_PCY_D_A]|uniref:hypothetical protein n=1 Tax=Microcoleus sp. PH2017_12_PCY_D_A TaxID=2798823 RepID=UPI002600C0D7
LGDNLVDLGIGIIFWGLQCDRPRSLFERGTKRGRSLAEYNSDLTDLILPQLPIPQLPVCPMTND